MKKRLIENLSALTITQLLNYALPFVTLPYLVRVLGMEGYGAYLFSQSFIAYFLIFVDFGFDLYATRLVAVHRETKRKVEEIISAVFAWKLVLLICSFIILIILTTFIPTFKAFQTLHILNFGMIVGTMLFANFYYQGIENMKYITILNATAKLIFTVLIFIFVRSEDDLVLTALINSSGYIVVGLFSLWIIHKKHKIRFVKVEKRVLLQTIKDSAPFFGSRVAVATYTVSNTFIIGLVLGNTAAGIFGSADKVFRGIISLYAPLNTVFYPFISRHKNIQLFKKAMKLASGINVIIAIAIFFSASYIINILFGSGYDEAIIILKIFSVVLIYIMPSLLLGYPLLGGMGYTKQVNLSVIYSAIFHIISLVILMPVLTVTKVAFLVVITELLVFLYRFYYIKKFKLLH